MNPHFLIIEVLLALSFIKGLFSYRKDSGQLLEKLKNERQERYAELSGAELIGGQWTTPGRTSKGVSYLFNDLDNNDPDIKVLKKKIRMAMVLIAVFFIGTLLNVAVFYVVPLWKAEDLF